MLDSTAQSSGDGGIAAVLYGLCGASRVDPPGAAALALALLGEEAIEYAQQFEPAKLVQSWRGGWRILVRRDATDAALNEGVARCLVQWAAESGVMRGWDAVDCDEVVADLLLPLEALSGRIQDATPNAAEIADEFVCSEAIVSGQLRRLVRPRRSGFFSRVGRSG